MVASFRILGVTSPSPSPRQIEKTTAISSWELGRPMLHKLRDKPTFRNPPYRSRRADALTG